MSAPSRALLWHSWLLAAAAAVLLFGVGLVILPDLLLALFNFLLFSSAKSSVLYAHNARGYISFAHAVLGAVMIGWSIPLLYLINGPFRRRERAAWHAVALSLIAWFVPDTATSLAGGYAGNAILNVGFLILFAVPLAATYTSFPAPRLGSVVPAYERDDVP